ncbi:MAG: hypothetical protein WKF96_12885 [Solirubrobacteraceae bacterium]
MDRDAPSPKYGVPPQARFQLQDAAARAIGAATAIRLQHERMLGFIVGIGDDLGAPDHPDDRLEQMKDTRARMSARLDQVEALRQDLADLMVDAPAYIGDEPQFSPHVEPVLDDLPEIAGGGNVNMLSPELRPVYIARVFVWSAEQTAKLLRDAGGRLREVLDLLAVADSEEARLLQERIISAMRALGVEP